MAGMIVIESACDAVRDPLSVALTVKFEVPELVGVPVIAPDDAFKFRPAGSEPVAIDQV